MTNTDERLKQAEQQIRKPTFRQNKGLGNEVGYYIFAYPPEDELTVREWVKYIQHKYDSRAEGFRVLVFDLYDIVIDILQERGYLDKNFEMEKKYGFDRITKAVGNTLRITAKDSLIISYIQERIEENSVVFLTGIGKCYPLLRSHTVLNNLHQVIDSVPVILFYPGKYDGQELILFGEVKDDNYYRAFKLVD